MEHTKGEWTVGKIGAKTFIYSPEQFDVNGKTQGKKPIAQVAPLGQFKEQEAEANARLLAAAPALLEALKFYVGICGNTASSVTPETALEMYETGKAVINRVRLDLPSLLAAPKPDVDKNNLKLVRHLNDLFALGRLHVTDKFRDEFIINLRWWELSPDDMVEFYSQSARLAESRK
jgi:hypothetical protein